MNPRGKERVLGPYEQANGWRIIEVAANGERTYTLFPTQIKAQRYKELLEASLSAEEHSTATALALYEQHLKDKGDKPASIDVTKWAIGLFFVEPTALRTLTAKKCERLYDAMRVRPSARTGKPPAVDTHRNALAQAKSFLRWCAKQRWVDENPLEDVSGIGKRRPRGKSLGKAGNELRVKDARVWYAKAVSMARGGDEGAVAALVALLLGMRASEITSRRVSDLDQDERAGDLLWIPCSKTPAGRRTLEVPEALRPMLVEIADSKTSDSYLFERDRQHELGCGLPHRRDWLIDQVHRICDAARVKRVTAHAMRGMLATISGERGVAGHVIAATLGHEDERTSFTAYAAPGTAAAGARRRGFEVLNGGKTAS